MKGVQRHEIPHSLETRRPPAPCIGSREAEPEEAPGKGYRGHSLSISDIVELYDGDNRRFFYCDTVGYVPVEFDAAQAAPMGDADGNG